MNDYEIIELGNVLLQSGVTLPEARLAYKTYGELNAARVPVPARLSVSQRPMADMFLSYVRQDLERAKPLVKALEEQSRSVGWDLTHVAVILILGITPLWGPNGVQSSSFLHETRRAALRSKETSTLYF